MEDDEGRNDDSPLNAYEKEKRIRIARNNEALREAGIKFPSNIMAALNASTKKSIILATSGRHKSLLHGRAEPPQLRNRNINNNKRINVEGPSQRRSCTHIDNEEQDHLNQDADYVVDDDDLQTPDDEDEASNKGQSKKRKGRGHTVKHDIWMRKENESKIHVQCNEKNQPIGEKAAPLSNFISTIVRSGIPLSSPSWFEVDDNKKTDLWDIVQLFFDVKPELQEWVMKQAAMRWRNFKCEIKRTYFNPNKDLNDEQLFQINIDKRVPKSDWIWLVRYWRTPESEVLSAMGKANCAKMTMTHTTGSKSLARVADDWFKEHGYMPARHEVFIKAHTRKNGNIQGQAEDKINEIYETCDTEPELATKTIEEGDLFSKIFGKEKRARIRAVGLGPTPQDLNMAGVRKCSSIKLQMAMFAKLKAEKESAILRERLDSHEEQLSHVLQEMEKLKKSVDLGGGIDNVDNNRASNSPVQNVRDDIDNVQLNNNHASNSQAQDMRGHTNNVALNDNRASNSSVQHMRCRSDDSAARSIANVKRIPSSEIMPRKIVARQEISTNNREYGQNVILYSVAGPYVPVAKATIKRTSRAAIVGGAPLGLQYCEVLVDYVLKKNATLPRPYNNLAEIGHTKGRTIAWPYERMEDDVARVGGLTHAERNQVSGERMRRES